MDDRNDVQGAEQNMEANVAPNPQSVPDDTAEPPRERYSEEKYEDPDIQDVDPTDEQNLFTPGGDNKDDQELL